MQETPLRGMLHKQHNNSRFVSWGKRYFEVNDELGILYYFRTKSAQRWDEPARHFELESLRSCLPLNLSKHSFGLELTISSTTYPIKRLVLRASSETERQQWLCGLQSRIAKLRLASGHPSANCGVPSYGSVLQVKNAVVDQTLPASGMPEAQVTPPSP